MRTLKLKAKLKNKTKNKTNLEMTSVKILLNDIFNTNFTDFLIFVYTPCF